jgi:hypothetical protein
MLKVGDTIKCADTDDAVKTMQQLSEVGVETDFLQELKGQQGIWLEIKKITDEAIRLYALIDNYHDRKKIPDGIFLTEERAEAYLLPIIEGHERRGENYDYDIEEFVIDPLLIDRFAAVGRADEWKEQ